MVSSRTPKLIKLISLALALFLSSAIHAQITAIGSGSYTTSFPGTDEAGRNGFPSGSPQLSGVALGKPAPTNDWWSKLLLEDHADNLFNYPLTMKTTSSGLIVTYVPWGVIGDNQAIVAGVSGLNSPQTNVSNYSDWTVTMDWSDQFEATAGIGMPFVYFEKGSGEIAQIKVNSGSVTVSNEMLLITNASSGADFAVYAPAGSSWSQSGSTYTSSLNGNNYWSMVMLPQDGTNSATSAEEYKAYAYVFPTNTTADYNYDESTSILRTDFSIETDVKEGTGSYVLQGLLPHQWDHLANDSAVPTEDTYSSVRGDLKMLAGNSFSTENSFHGILPTLPYLSNYSEGFSISELNDKIELLENEGLATWTDSYNEGQVMNRLIQTARIADKIGNLEARDKMIATVKERLEDWLKAESAEVAFVFYYNTSWSTLIGYPAGHGQDTNINDHHFHWGYFIHAAAFIEQYEPGWADHWGRMIEHLIRDAAGSDRDDNLFPYLRSFSPYAGHSWANGFAFFPQGNDQESTSESMQFNSSLIHWGSITGNDEIRDLGIYLYTTEQSAIEEYWFDQSNRIFPDNPYSVVSRVWGNSYDNGTFWTSDLEASYGIELYPIHGGSMYLGHNISYAESLWAEMENNTGVLSNDDNVNLWHDTWWKYLAYTDPQKAIDLYDSYADRNLKFGISDAQTYYWLHAMNALGTVDASITADHELAVAFIQDGDTTYVAHNYSAAPITVSFSDGFTLDVPARSMATNQDVDISGTISTSFESTYAGGSVDLSLIVTSGTVTKVEFYEDGVFVGEDTAAPYSWTAGNLVAGVYNFYAKMYEGESFEVSNIVTIISGEQEPYNGVNHPIPGTIEAGHYDVFTGGNGNGIAYLDTSPGNNGDFRSAEDVDAVDSGNEGSSIGWIAAGEWVEYTMDIASSGYYDLSFRFASDNQAGGGPFHIELDDQLITGDIPITYTAGWDDWETSVVKDLEMPEGNHTMRLQFEHGEFNIANMTFTRIGDLPYGPPIAHAGNNISAISPNETAALDGSMSVDPDDDALTYAWTQINGPSMLIFEDNTLANTSVSNLIDGIYTCELTVSDGQHQDSDQVLIIVSETGNSDPTVVIITPLGGTSFEEGSNVLITATASDLEGEITKVEFYAASTKIGEDLTEPFEYNWEAPEIGNYDLTAVATDEDGATSTSALMSIAIVGVEECTEAGDEAQQGDFSIGYKSTFQTIGTDVTISFELLDGDKTGVVAILWQQDPFNETYMDHVSGNKFSTTLRGQTIGNTISYACKFEFAGGLAVTKYIQYEVGTDCDETGESDTDAPESFTATVGRVASTSIELILNASDDFGTVIYTANTSSKSWQISAASGVETSLILNGLNPETSYDITVSVSDLIGNLAPNGPLTLSGTTTEDPSTACMGISDQGQEGSFQTGYSYAFETVGSDVIISFELLDTDKSGVFAYLWKQTPFGETAMTNVSDQHFTATVANQTVGTIITYACKFEFANGLAVTKYFSYTVGDNCSGTGVLSAEDLDAKGIQVYPNPVSDQLIIQSKENQVVGVERVFGIDGKEQTFTWSKISNRLYVDFSAIPRGIYIIQLRTDGGILHSQVIKN